MMASFFRASLLYPIVFGKLSASIIFQQSAGWRISETGIRVKRILGRD
jgi:hypothetical protein